MDASKVILNTLVSLYNEGKLPSISFGPELPFVNEIRLLSATDPLPSEFDSKEIISKWISEYQNNSEAIGVLIEASAKAMADKLKEGESALKSIRELVVSLAKEIDERTEAELNANETYKDAVTRLAYEPSYPIYDFSCLDELAGSEDVLNNHVGELTNTLVIEDPKVRFETAVLKFLPKALFNVSISSLTVSEEITNEIVKSVNESNAQLTADGVQKALTTLIDKTAIERTIEQVKRLLENKLNPQESIFMLVPIAKELFVCSALYQQLSTKDIDQAALEENIKAINALIEVSVYYCRYYLRTVYYDTVLFSNETKNYLLKDAIAENAISDKEIYWRLKRLSSPLSRLGLTLTSLLKDRDKTSLDAEEIRKKDEILVVITKRNTLRQSIAISLEKYFKANETEIDFDEILKEINERLLTNVPVEDIIYNIIIFFNYKDTIVSDMYKELGDQYIVLLSESDEITEAQKNEATMLAYGRIISNFIQSHFLVN